MTFWQWFTRMPEPVIHPASPPPVLPQSSRFKVCLAETLGHEGGYVDHPDDPGGATNLGITHETLAAWRGKPVTKMDVRDITLAEAAAIYHARYWLPIRGDALPQGVDLAVFDFSVNSGPGRAVKCLQSVLGITQDGAVGPMTLAAIGRASPAALVMDLCDARMRFLRGLKTWPTFGKGWTKRVAAVEAAALG
jgi:lysozyme family protein